MATNAKATQDFVPIKEIRDGIITLKDGSMRSVVMVSSLNFALKSPDEQEAIIFQFQNFLNSLDFSLQISIQSRALDIRPYLAKLEEQFKNELNDLMKIQIREYIQFIRSFVEQSNIMTKTFFVVVPYSPMMLTNKNNPIANAFSGDKNKKPEELSADRGKQFEENRTQIEQRVSIVQQGLMRSGLRSVVLGTDEVVELFYKIFNPGDLEKPIIPA